MRKSLFRIAKRAFPQCRRGFPAVSDGRSCKTKEPLWRHDSVVKAEKKVKSGGAEGVPGHFRFLFHDLRLSKIFTAEMHEYAECRDCVGKTESLRRAFIIVFLSHARAEGMRSFRRRHEHSAPQMVSIPARSMAS